MVQTIRVSLPGYDALTDTNPDHYALYSDNDWILIKEKANGSGSVTSGNTAIIAHNLGYIPMYFVYVQVSATEWQIVNFVSSENGWNAYADTTNLYIANNYSSYTNYRYYIFYDLMT